MELARILQAICIIPPRTLQNKSWSFADRPTSPQEICITFPRPLQDNQISEGQARNRVCIPKVVELPSGICKNLPKHSPIRISNHAAITQGTCQDPPGHWHNPPQDFARITRSFANRSTTLRAICITFPRPPQGIRPRMPAGFRPEQDYPNGVLKDCPRDLGFRIPQPLRKTTPKDSRDNS